MPKLYYSPHRANEPDASDPWQIPGAQDKKAERVDVPASPAELATWLNARRVPLTGGAIDRFATEIAEWAEQGCEEPPQDLVERVVNQPRVAGHCDACGRSAAGTLKLQQGNDLDAIGNWMETAELWAIKQLVERAREVVHGRDQALDGKGVQ